MKNDSAEYGKIREALPLEGVYRLGR